MGKYNFLSLSILILLNCCSSSQQNEPSHIYILDRSEYLMMGESRIFFIPTADDIFLADSIVGVYLRTNSPYVNEDIMINDYTGRYRQYLGIIDSLDRKIIYVNTFCNEDDTLRAEQELVLGFGECYFNLLVFLKEKVCVKPSNTTYSED